VWKRQRKKRCLEAGERTISDLIKSSSPAGFSPVVPSALNSFSVVRGERKEKKKTNVLQLNWP